MPMITQYLIHPSAGVLLFRAHQAALSSSGMRASADELSAWEALTVSLVVRVGQAFLSRLMNTLVDCLIPQGCVRWLDRCPYSS